LAKRQILRSLGIYQFRTFQKQVINVNSRSLGSTKVAARMAEACSNCGANVSISRGKSFSRTGLHGQLKRAKTTPASVLSEIAEISVSPQRTGFLCQDCSNSLQATHNNSVKAEESFKSFLSATQSPTYLGQKLKASHSFNFSPRTTSTPSRSKTKIKINICTSTPKTPVKRAAEKSVKKAVKCSVKV
jgi:hypothetical protein